MNFPVCDATHSTEALPCDCGYIFPGHEQAITLAWRQKLAGYWSIAWPGLLLAMVTFTVLLSIYSDEDVVKHPRGIQFEIWAACSLAFFGPQAFLAQRLVRKNYRSFRVVVWREGQAPSRRLTETEGRALALRLVALQVAFVIGYVLLLSVVAAIGDPTAVRPFGTLIIWLQFLTFGPVSLGIALRASYLGFRLHAYGQRYI